MATYRIHAASIEPDGLHLFSEPRAEASTLAEALELAGDDRHHGPEGAAIVTPDGRTIWTAEEYERAADCAACGEDYTPDDGDDDDDDEEAR